MRRDFRDLHSADANRNAPAEKAVDSLRRDVADQVAEAVDVDHLPFDAVVQAPGLRQIEPLETVDLGTEVGDRHAARAVAGHRGEDVAGVEGLALRMQEVLRAIEVNDGAHRRALGCEAEQAVVGADEHEAIGLDQDRPACGTHARIDHREVDRSRREVRHRAGQHERSAGHVLGRYVVAQIDDSGGRTDSEQHPLDDADEAVSLAEIGEQRDDRGVRSFRNTLRRCGGSSRCCRRTPTVRAHGRSISSRSAAHSSGNMIS